MTSLVNENSFPTIENQYILSPKKEKLIKDGTKDELRENIIILLNEINKLKKENSDLKVRNAACSYAQIQLLNAEGKIKDLQEENLKTMEKHYKEQKLLEKEIENLKLLREKDEALNRTNREIFNQRIEIMNQIDEENRIDKEEIKILKEKNEKLKIDSENKLRTQQINNEIKYNELKSKMLENLKETQRNVTKLNIQYMNVSDKLTILQNNELITQIEFQSQKIGELEENIKTLKAQISSLENELLIHRNVELNLANKLKNKVIKNKKLNSENNINDSNSIKENSFSNIFKNQKEPFTNRLIKSYLNKSNSNSIYGGFNDSNTIFISGQEKKINNLEKIIENKNNDIISLKNQLVDSRLKIANYEKKYSGLFNFFEDCLNRFFNDEEIKKNQKFFIKIDSIKKCDFIIFSNEEKYKLLVLIMKYLLPIINLNFNATCNIGNNIFKTNLNVINTKYNQTQNFLNDSFLKKAFLGKNNKLKANLNSKGVSSIYYNSIPIMKKEQIKSEPKLSNPKFRILIK